MNRAHGQSDRTPGDCWVITSYYNPLQYRSRRKNFDVFRKGLKGQRVHLAVAESAHGDHPFVLGNNDADIVLQVRSASALWQKESLLNALLRKLPSSCDSVAWVDADVCFQDDAWADRLKESLVRFPVVQPYSIVRQAPEGWDPDMPDAWGQLRDAESGPSTASCLGQGIVTDPDAFRGHPGYAVAARRDVIDQTGFYDRMVLGGGDSLFLGACYGMSMTENRYITKHTIALARHSKQWCDRVRDLVRGNVGCLDGDVAHLWHGDRMKRFYGERHVLLSGFDPVRDVKPGENGCMEWTGEAAPTLKQNVEEYFAARSEDGNASQETAALALLNAERANPQ